MKEFHEKSISQFTGNLLFIHDETNKKFDKLYNLNLINKIHFKSD